MRTPNAQVALQRHAEYRALLDGGASDAQLGAWCLLCEALAMAVFIRCTVWMGEEQARAPEPQHTRRNSRPPVPPVCSVHH